MKQPGNTTAREPYGIADIKVKGNFIKMLNFNNKTIYTDLEHNSCTIILLIVHFTLLLWTLISCSLTCMVVHILPELNSIQHKLLTQYSVVGYMTALICVLMSSIDVIMLGEWRLGTIMCDIWYCLDTLLNMTCAWISALLMLHQLLSGTISQIYLSISNRCKSLVSIIPWALSTLLTLVGMGLQYGTHNLIYPDSNNMTMGQCYAIDRSSKITVYYIMVIFFVPYTLTFIFYMLIKFKLKHSTMQSRLIFSQSFESLSDILLESETQNNCGKNACMTCDNQSTTLQHFAQHTMETSYGHKRSFANINARNSSYKSTMQISRSYLEQNDTCCGTTSSLGSSYITKPETNAYLYNKCVCACHKLQGIREHRQNDKTTDSKVPKRRKAGCRCAIVAGKHVSRKKHSMTDSHLAVPKKVVHHKMKRSKCARSTVPQSAYIIALHKAKNKYRVHSSYQPLDSGGSEKNEHETEATSMNGSAERIEQIYVNQAEYSDITVCKQDSTHQQPAINLHCCLHCKAQCCTSGSNIDNTDASSSDSESSQGLMKQCENEKSRTTEDIIMTPDKSKKEQHRAANHIAFVALIYTLLWLPFVVMRIILTFYPRTVIYHYVYTSLHLTGYVASGICPWLYYVLHGYLKISTWSNIKYRFFNPQSDNSLSSSSDS